MNIDGYPTREPGRYQSSRDHYSSRGGGAGGERDDRRDRDRDRERRRSRSPGHRRDRPSRRDHEPDTYSSSRDYQAREREDRYSRRRDDREWDRDRGDRRREFRRDDDETNNGGSRRRDRGDLFDDRGGRRGGRERDPAGGRERKKSATPPPKKREPTPDLTNIVSILDKKRRLTQWDIKPPGYENVTAEQAKLSGMFPLPGAPRQQPMDPSRLQAFINQPMGSADNAALKPSNARQSRRLFVTNFPPMATEESLVEFFNLNMNGLNVVQGPDPCLSAQFAHDKEFAMLEFKTPSDATLALAYDGAKLVDDGHQNGTSNGASQGIKTHRPKDYIVPSASTETEQDEGVLSATVPDSPNKLCISNMPIYLTEEQVTELLEPFGKLKAFVLVKDNDTQESRGIAFAEYVDPNATDMAIEGLNGMDLGEMQLKVQRASIGATQVAGLEMGVNAMSMFAGTTSNDHDETRVLQLLNMVTAEELMDNEDYEGMFLKPIFDECSKFGKVLDMKIPRPTGGSRQSSGVGKIFIKFDSPESAGKALRALAGRKFADRTVVTTYFSEENFEVNAW
ncbi:MAG: hypothetical protein M1834_001693 [Cirrosporium novae-zelandiae]|nr:MAG: hypothetical protein M1834_001693 [Cirrosporium novae-zelandiae]